MVPDISVIIPVYNCEKYLQDCIDSLVHQTKKEIEFIFINDASTDLSLTILEENALKIPNMRIINYPTNRSQGGARNLGIKEAKAKWIGFLDADDFIANDMFELLYSSIEKYDCDMVAVRYTPVAEDKHPNDIKASSAEYGVKVYNTPYDVLTANIYGGVGCCLFNKGAIYRNKVFFPERIKYEDNCWGPIMRLYVNKLCEIDAVKYYYRQNPNSTVHVRNKFAEDRVIAEQMLIDEVKARGFFDKFYNVWEECFIRLYFYNTFMLLIDSYDHPRKQFMRKITKQLNCQFPNWKANELWNNNQSKETIEKAKKLNRSPIITVWKHKILMNGGIFKFLKICIYRFCKKYSII